MYIFVDYDGTLVKNSEEEFMKVYFSILSRKVKLPVEKIFNLVMHSIYEITKIEDSSKNLFERFLESISKKTGKDKNYWYNIFLEFYKNEFDELRKFIIINEKLTNFIKYSNYKFIFASNPLFPEIAVKKRIEFVNLSLNNFFYIATMENSHYAKPNPKFFAEILEKLGIAADKCLMIGDTENDKASEKVGIKFINVNNFEPELIKIYFEK
ncbi:HAD superfamily hydrolase (TIGR01549 family) [Thermosipho japonicus]|uniref:HAD superfamily hydrolase (TIGR01549 family) n=1 Tax=Thermosipho japonicus TaxID=90323 RepID=A0A841GHI3_9BACT|nr:HAD-IA family hydrolase [Thermosipho japonicus]MBB6063166.1 HAD superfamily hydrolase (TIGR01549 family) [Thermosipho japonicus]